MTRRAPKTATKNLDPQKVTDRKAMARDRDTKKKEAARVLGKREAGA